jgi:hypothetical protein
MDLKTLKIKHPETYAAAVAEGEAKEHDRVSAHLMCGQKFDAMPVALRAIKEKTGLTAELQDEYLSTATNRLEQRARQLDSDEAGEVLEGSAAPTQLDQDNVDKVAAAMGLSLPKQAANGKPDNVDKVAAAMGLTRSVW